MTALRAFAAASLGLALIGPVAHAAENPSACGPDPRERCVIWKPGQIVRLYLAPGATETLEFPASEKIMFAGVSDNQIIAGGINPSQRVATGRDSTGDPNLMVWIPGAPEAPEQFMTLKAQHELEPQPLVVLTWWINPVTNERQIRRHIFELLTRPGDLTEATANTYYAVHFLDPAADRAASRARWLKRHRAEMEAIQAERVADRLATSVLGSSYRNVAYDGQGTDTDRAALAPSAPPGVPSIWDDGERTYLRYPGNRRPPMIFQVLADGKTEGVVGQSTEIDPTTHGNILVVNTVAALLRLRENDNVLCIINRNFDATGRNTGTGTVDPGVLRVNRSPTDGK